MSVAVESSGLPSMRLIIAGDVMESLDVYGRINRAKAFAEPSFGSADIVHVEIDQWVLGRIRCGENFKKIISDTTCRLRVYSERDLNQ